jgi:HAD superfamily hydrolase (TIGR01509 family)
MNAAVLFDVDGTLVDSNYLHVVAWWRSFRSQGYDVAMTRLHRTVGQGSDQLVESVLGHPDDAVSAAHTDFYGPFLHEVVAFPAAGEVLRAAKKLGCTVVLATSASKKEAEHLTGVIDADDAIDAITTKDDVDASKPAPDVVASALDKARVDAADAVFVGDTVWDIEAAKKVGVDCIALLSGGISEAELRDAGAVAVYRDVADLLKELDRSPIGALARRDVEGR